MPKPENNKENIFLLGSQNDYQLLKNWTQNEIEQRYHLNGWFHDKELPSSIEKLIGEFNSIIGSESVNHFILEPDGFNNETLEASIEWAESKGARVHLIQSDTNTIMQKLERTNRFGPFASITLIQEPLSIKKNQIIKLIFDKIFSFVVITFILSWLIPLLGILIKLNSKGPIIILQDRIGMNGQKYKCYKFRTMISDKTAEQGYGLITQKDDKRITSIGIFLRKTNFDELPQFINVLFGDMSVIGPRPNPIKEDMEISERIKKYKIRRFVKPGITGFAAIHGFRGSTNDLGLMQKRIDLDIEYIENWSFWLDLKIAFITFWQMLTFQTGGK